MDNVGGLGALHQVEVTDGIAGVAGGDDVLVRLMVCQEIRSGHLGCLRLWLCLVHGSSCRLECTHRRRTDVMDMICACT